MFVHFPWVEIDLTAISHNLGIIRKIIGKKVRIAGVVKANAYGHGLIEIARFLEKQRIDYLCVARISEALELRENRIKTPILILGYTPPQFFKEIVNHNLTVTIRSLDVAKSLVTEARRKNKMVKVHIKVETGMHRIGIETPYILFFLKKIFDLPNLEVEGIFTHFAEADNLDLSFTRLQLTRFQEVVQELIRAKIKIPIYHTANSAATLRIPESYFNMVRVGIALYGLEPFPGAKEIVGLKPAMTLKTKIIQIKEIPAHEFIGYGRTYETPKTKIVGTIAIGYGDGFRRSPQNWSEVLVRGQRCQILGRVAMDSCQIDLSSVLKAEVGDEVVLIGKSRDEIITVEQVAHRLGTINYEVVAGLMERVKRVYKN